MTRLSIEQRFGVACAVSVAGGLVALCLMIAERHIKVDYAIFRMALGGAFVAGLVVADGLGRRGWKGFAWAILAFGTATVAGAFLAVCLMPIDEMWSFTPAAFFNPTDTFQVGLMAPVYLMEIALKEATVLNAWMLVGALVHAIALNLRAPEKLG